MGGRLPTALCSMHIEANCFDRSYSRPHIDKKAQFDFLRGIVRPKKRFNKWLKPIKEEDLAVVKEYYGYNDTHAQGALRILTESQLDVIKKKLNRGGK